MITTILLAITIATTDTLPKQTLDCHRLINNVIRYEDKAPELVLDTGLTRLAYKHCVDLYKYRSNDCALISWSKYSGYSYGCITAADTSMAIMFNKPREVLGYNARGYELVCLGKKDLTHVDAMVLLINNRFYRSQLGNPQFTKIGVYVYRNIVSVWLM